MILIYDKDDSPELVLGSLFSCIKTSEDFFKVAGRHLSSCATIPSAETRANHLISRGQALDQDLLHHSASILAMPLPTNPEQFFQRLAGRLQELFDFSLIGKAQSLRTEYRTHLQKLRQSIIEGHFHEFIEICISFTRNRLKYFLQNLRAVLADVKGYSAFDYTAFHLSQYATSRTIQAPASRASSSSPRKNPSPTKSRSPQPQASAEPNERQQKLMNALQLRRRLYRVIEPCKQALFEIMVSKKEGVLHSLIQKNRGIALQIRRYGKKARKELEGKLKLFFKARGKRDHKSLKFRSLQVSKDRFKDNRTSLYFSHFSRRQEKASPRQQREVPMYTPPEHFGYRTARLTQHHLDLSNDEHPLLHGVQSRRQNLRYFVF